MNGFDEATQQMTPEQAALAGGIFFGVLLFVLFIVLIIYIYYAICLVKIAKKAGITENVWFAWIPLLNVILMLQIAKKPLWWIILFFIPLVNIVISILVYMEISKAIRKPDWLGILMLVPIVNFVVMGYWAFSKDEPLQETPLPKATI
jgi:magnesium-transporting ATPase (P-type)